MSEKEEPSIKVTDKRMFAPDGTLREEYRFLEEETKERRGEEPEETTGEPTIVSPEGPTPGGGPAAGPGGSPRAGEAPGAVRPSGPAAQTGPAPGPRAEPESGLGSGPGDDEEPDWPPSDTAGGRKPSFLDLVAALAEPASVYLRNALESPGEASQSLEVARLYIDLLDVLRQKTEGNLTPQESSMLEDALGQLRLGYVQTRG